MKRTLTAKFWIINGTAIVIIIVYILGLVTGNTEQWEFWRATPFQLAFLFSVIYLFSEGRMIQRVMLAEQIKEKDIAQEFSTVNKVATKVEDKIPFKK